MIQSTFFSSQCQDVAAFLQYKVPLLPVEQYQKVLKLVKEACNKLLPTQGLP